MMTPEEKLKDLIDAAAHIDEIYAGEDMDEFEREVNRERLEREK